MEASKLEQIPRQSASVRVSDGSVPVVHRDGVPGRPALVIVPSVFGITDDLIGQMEALSADASVVVAMDLFWREEPGPLAYGDMPTVMARLQRLDRARAYEDYEAVVASARSHPGADGRVIGLGICFGGPFCFVGAADGLLDGVVTWHGSRLDAFLERADAMRCPMALHFGSADRVVPMETVERVREAFSGRADVEIVVHAGADHGFTHPNAPTFDPDAAAASMESVRRMLRDL